jgi:ubiquinone/menaquinone biosynthesis C-methylase UbiE
LSLALFDGDVARRYERGRKMTASEIRTWTDLFNSALRTSPIQTRRILDLGSGTGRFSPSLAEQCDAKVVALEPSDAMRRMAQQVNGHTRVTYVGGRAEQIPLASESCDAAFLFLSLHHFSDLQRAACEMARVVRVGGTIFIRTEFADRPHLTYWHGLMPGAAAIDRALYPTYGRVISALSQAMIEITRLDRVPYLASKSLGDYIERLRALSLSAHRVFGHANTQVCLSGLSFDHSELTQPIREIGHVMICRRLK